VTTTHPFLSDKWIQAAQELRQEFAEELSDPPLSVVMNVVVTEIPHRNGNLEGHIDTSKGGLTIELGHLEQPNLSLEVDYETAKAAFVTRDQQAVMQAFFAGRIFVEGDVSVLLALQAEPPGDTLVEMYRRLRALTSDD